MSIQKHEWQIYHTVWSIVVRVIGEVLTKNTTVFYADYQTALMLKRQQFSYIVIANQLGSFGAMLAMPFITKLIPALSHKISLFGFICGLSSIAFVFAPSISSNPTFILWFCCIDRLIFGITYFIYVTSILDLASSANINKDKKGRVIALLEVSWTIASLFYIVVGYSIEFINWDFNFIFFGAMLCIASIISHFVFAGFGVSAVSASSNVSWFDNIKSVIWNKVSLLMFSGSVLMGIFTSSFTVIVSSLWFEDVFGLNSFHVGLIALTAFGGELCASMSVSYYIDQYGVWKCSFVAFGSAMAASMIICILSIAIGPSIGGLVAAICMVFVLYFGWEGFYIIHQILCINNKPSEDLTSMMILTNFVCLAAGNMIGSYVSPFLWMYGEGLTA